MMQLKFIFLWVLLGFCFTCLSQDTLRVEPSFHYTREQAKALTGKGFHGNYAREDIVFSEKHQRIAYCYYIDQERHCSELDYEIKKDSQLFIGHADYAPEVWRFKPLANGHYRIFRTHQGLHQTGTVASLIPLRPIAPIITTAPQSPDTLWTTSYSRKEHQLEKWTSEFHQSPIEGKIWEYTQIDQAPKQLNGAALPALHLEATIPCFSEPQTTITTLAVIITKTGAIKNIEQAIGSLSPHCPYTMQEIVAEVVRWGKLQPATRKGQAVNVRWFIQVDMERNYLHPLFIDNPKNRKRYLKRKRAAQRKRKN